jgi:hypothetical protein
MSPEFDQRVRLAALQWLRAQMIEYLEWHGDAVVRG